MPIKMVIQLVLNTKKMLIVHTILLKYDLYLAYILLISRISGPLLSIELYTIALSAFDGKNTVF